MPTVRPFALLTLTLSLSLGLACLDGWPVGHGRGDRHGRPGFDWRREWQGRCERHPEAVFAYGTVNNQANGYYAFWRRADERSLSVHRSERFGQEGSRFAGNGRVFVWWNADDNIGLCAHLKEFARFAGLDAAGGHANADDTAKYVAMQNSQIHSLYYFYDSFGNSDGIAGTSAAASASGVSCHQLTTASRDRSC